MQRFIETQNIVHFKRLLETETDPGKRTTLLQLVKEEEAKLVFDVEGRTELARARKPDLSNPSSSASDDRICRQDCEVPDALDN